MPTAVSPCGKTVGGGFSPAGCGGLWLFHCKPSTTGDQRLTRNPLVLPLPSGPRCGRDCVQPDNSTAWKTTGPWFPLGKTIMVQQGCWQKLRHTCYLLQHQTASPSQFNIYSHTLYNALSALPMMWSHRYFSDNIIILRGPSESYFIIFQLVKTRLTPQSCFITAT